MAKHGWKDQGPFWESEDGDAVTWDAQAQELGVQIHAADNDGHRDGETEIPLPVLRALLAAQGLHVVSEAELDVLDAAREWRTDDCTSDAVRSHRSLRETIMALPEAKP